MKLLASLHPSRFEAVGLALILIAAVWEATVLRDATSFAQRIQRNVLLSITRLFQLGHDNRSPSGCVFNKFAWKDSRFFLRWKRPCFHRKMAGRKSEVKPTCSIQISASSGDCSSELESAPRRAFGSSSPIISATGIRAAPLRIFASVSAKPFLGIIYPLSLITALAAATVAALTAALGAGQVPVRQ